MDTKLLGRFDPNLIKIVDTGHKYVPKEPLSSQAEVVWEEGKKRFGDNLWNGINYRFEKFDPATSTLFLGQADYKYNFTSNALIGIITKLDFTERPNCIYISSVIITSDEKVVLGQTPATSIHGASLSLVGGILNKDEMRISSGPDLVWYLYKELEEELGITAEMISETTGLGIYDRSNCRIGIFVKTLLNLTAEELTERLVIEKKELDEVVFKTCDEILAEAPNNPMYKDSVPMAIKLIKEGNSDYK